MSTPINIIIDNKTVLDDVESCEIQMQDSDYCLSVSLSLKSKRFWTLCDPVTKFGTLRIKVVIGSDTYKFLAEERDTSPSVAGVGFTVWGRSKQALLVSPYSKTITDTDTTNHPWQTANTTASAIVAYVVSNYCPYAVTVTWNAGDFAVYKDSFSVSNQSPVDIISSLASVIGAELVADADGSLSVEAHSVAEGTSVQSYNDMDHIVQLSETIGYPSGYNAVTVYGYDPASSAKSSAYLSVERIAAFPGDEMGEIYPGVQHKVRVYCYHSEGLQPIADGADPAAYNVDATSISNGVENITEDVTLIFGKGSTSKPNTKGVSEVTGSETEPYQVVSVTYSTNYYDFAVPEATLPDGEDSHSYSILFYFSDKSATTMYSFTVQERPDDESQACGDVVIEKDSPENLLPGSTLNIRIYGSMRPVSAKSSADVPTIVTAPVAPGLGSTSGGSAAATIPLVFNNSLPVPEYSNISYKTDTVTFINGEADLSYPVYGNYTPRYVFPSIRGVPPSVKYKNGEKTLVVESFIDDATYYAVVCNVSYYSSFIRYAVKVPITWPSEVFMIWFTFEDCEIKEASFDLVEGSADDPTETHQDITITVKDYITDAAVSGASVYIDGTLKGTTDTEGNLNISSIAVGEHTIKITKSGYENSDIDTLANDTFTVS